jgi:hypothetical protein
MADSRKGYLGVLGFGIHILSGLFALGLAVNFVWSLIKRDLSPWWFWPAGIVAVFVLMITAATCFDLRTRTTSCGTLREQKIGVIWVLNLRYRTVSIRLRTPPVRVHLHI